MCRAHYIRKGSFALSWGEPGSLGPLSGREIHSSGTLDKPHSSLGLSPSSMRGGGSYYPWVDGCFSPTTEQPMGHKGLDREFREREGGWQGRGGGTGEDPAGGGPSTKS